MSKSVLVLGAGMIGVSVAYRLSQSRNADVTLVDAGSPGQGTTGTSGSLVGANEKRPDEYYRLGRLSMDAMGRLNAELGGHDWYNASGHMEWADSETSRAMLHRRVETLAAWDYGVEWVDRKDVGRLEPDIALPDGIDAVAYFAKDSIIHPHISLALMLRSLRSAGARLLFSAGPAELLVGAEGVDGIVLADGRTLKADVVVVAAGRWTETVLSKVGVAVPLVSPSGPTAEAVGFQVITTRVAALVSRMVRMPGLSIRPAGGGHLLLHGRPEESELHSQGTLPIEWDRPLMPHPPQAGALVSKAKAVLRHADGMVALGALASVRAITQDGLPAVGWAPGHSRLYVVVTHSGIGLAPLLGELVTEELRGTTSDALESFRLERFLSQDGGAGGSPMRAVPPGDAPTN